MKRIVVCACALSAFLFAQDPEAERLRALEMQNREILNRLSASEAKNADLERELIELRGEHEVLRSETEGEVLENQINAVSARMQDASVTFKDLTRSGCAIKFYGFLRLDAYYSSARMNSAVIPFFVQPENDVVAEDSNDDQFFLDPRMTRFAFDINAGKIGDAVVTGKVETDFSSVPNGNTESRATPRMRLAYINLSFGETYLRLGQDWDIIAPIFPAINHETLMWNAGNLGDRRAQAQFGWVTGDPKGTEFSLKLAAGLTGAVDAGDLDAGAGVMRPFTSTEFDGLDSGHPHGQVRAGLGFNSWVEGQRATIGVWGYLAGLEADTRFSGEDHFTPYTVGIDLHLPLFDVFALRGEIYLGQALSDVRGTIGQTINTATGEEIDSWGGWAELVIQATADLKLSFGGTIDNPDGDDLPTGGRDLNWSIYGNMTYNWGSGLTTGFDAIYWETQWDTIGLGNTLRFDIYCQLNF